ncbi:MAG: TQO small subunit DoxD [Candidatus Methylomirabilales bacterium]
MTAMPASSSTLVPGLALALFRMGFGILYLHMAWQKAPWIVTDGHRFGWLYGYIEKEIAHPTFGWYAAFLKGVVLPNFTLFGYMSFFTELVLGASLLLGLFTVLGGLGGALWMVNIMLGSYSIPGEWPWLWFLLIAPQLVFAHAHAGRVLGIDALLHRRLAAAPAERGAISQAVLKVA